MNKKRTSSISESVRARFQVSSSTKKLLLDLFVLFQLLSGVILGLSLLTFSINDFQWMESPDAAVSNSIGLVGAWISSLLYSFLGLSAWIISLILFINPLNYYLKKTDELDGEAKIKSGVVTFLPIHNIVVVTSPMGDHAPPALAVTMIIPANHNRRLRS